MMDVYEYRKVAVADAPVHELDPDDQGVRKTGLESAANYWAGAGWRVVSVMTSPRGLGYADVLLIERRRDFLAVQCADGQGNTYVFPPEDVTFLFGSDA